MGTKFMQWVSVVPSEAFAVVAVSLFVGLCVLVIRTMRNNSTASRFAYRAAVQAKREYAEVNRRFWVAAEALRERLEQLPEKETGAAIVLLADAERNFRAAVDKMNSDAPEGRDTAIPTGREPNAYDRIATIYDKHRKTLLL